MHTSLRRTVAASLLPNARAAAAALGITRCSAITLLDVLGIPVWSVVRPNAHPDSVCVHAGKGASDTEAELSALLESIEFARAERHELPAGQLSVRALFHDARRPCDHIDLLSPRVDAQVDPDRQIAVVDAVELGSDIQRLVPLQLVAHRHADALDLFGTSTNGLGAGCARDEAILHALLEVIERDIASFEIVASRAFQVDPDSLPGDVCALLDRWLNLGVVCRLETAPNAFGVVYIRATLVEEAWPDATFICSGYGCHLDAEIAVWRAITEAAQSRLSLIHGARDDLAERDQLLASLGPDESRRYGVRLTAAPRQRQRLPEGRCTAGAQMALEALIVGLDRAGVGRPLVVDLSPDIGLPVVRVVVPGLEMFEAKHRRAGPRLTGYVGSTP